MRAIVAGYTANPGGMRNLTREMAVDGVAYLVRTSAIRDELKIDQVLASIAPVSDFTGHILRMQRRVFFFSCLVLLVVLPLGLFLSRKISRSLVLLELESKKIQQSDFSETEPFDSNVKEIHALISAFVLMKSTIRDYTARLIQAKKEIENLFTAVTELLADAIDAKSPYTGGHCQRVPALTMMLADATAQHQEGPLAAFSMTEMDRYELKIAGLLHDCGKVTTPVHVVDKATKLQTLYDRIDLIDTRFEVLKRDAEIEALRQQLALRPCVDEAAERAGMVGLYNQLGALDADRGFLRTANSGGVRHIGSHYQRRNPEHRQTDFLSIDEVDNLCIRKGTLTAAERDTINYHIVATNKMLEKLPWPKHLQNVPEYAGGHHERMDGKGYPKGLTREQMSVQARIMGIADIFEALTASDRPYKHGMKLSQAISIMVKMKEDGHIDADLFDVFIQQGVYLRYAHEFVDPMQIDEVRLPS